jgi:hypothetical protein
MPDQGIDGWFQPNSIEKPPPRLLVGSRHPLMRIDYYGEVLIGCIDCNRWGYPGDKKLTMELQEHDLEALRANVRRKHPPQ